MTKNYKSIGNRWADKSIELVQIGGVVYALHGWNGEKFIHSWRCSGQSLMDASEEEYEIEPIYQENESGDFDIIGYIVK